MHSSPTRLSIPLLLTLHLVVAHTLLGQDMAPGVHLEVSAGVIAPIRKLDRNERLKSAPFAGLGVVLRTPTRLSFRLRGAVGLTQGTAIVTEAGPSRFDVSQGRIAAGVGEVLLSVGRTGAIQVGFGVGTRRYELSGYDCVSGPCGSGRQSHTALAVSATASAGARAGAVGLGLEAGALLSRYGGRTMIDTMLGVRVRF